MKSLKIIVLAKQVPDTRNVGKDAMTAEGTVNRAALPAIFNPEDLNALEMALRFREQCGEGSEVMVLTMGPARATELIREAMFRGADGGILLTDRAFAGADTLATSYALAAAVRKMGADVIFAGRQAIDGDTAQVGPQVAEKLGWGQVTYAEQLEGVTDEKITIKRRIEGGVEVVETAMPVVITVTGSADECRPQNVRRIMKYKRAEIPEWGAQSVDADVQKIGLAGSPTKVKHIESIVFKAKNARRVEATSEGIIELMGELQF